MNFEVENLLDLRPEDMAPPETVQLHNSRIDPSGKNGNKFPRWQPVVIENLTSGGWTIRHARGGIGKTGLTKNSIVLDYDARIELAIVPEAANIIRVRKANWREVYRFYWRHKNSLIRITTRLAVISVALGAVGLALGFAGLAVSLLSLSS
ncbi:hypothetical protein [Geoalkalibacter subterraneus]|uniref:Uncharacterized protein n=1 Tax=Geoalkalibacter subterraneus TaxID=483547 RepID=A0A0B5FVF5_9BACT|nr:hypothetical protein [Geoalkalibacter subterraneus]AJF08160.1 hypothetical protein GSUB_16800 [Geoalkalibacter subterraneus]